MKRTKFLAILVVLSPALNSGQTSFHDLRNEIIASTDTHFTKLDVPSLRQWEGRKEQLRKQILFAAGLWPMPARTPLNAHIFGAIKRNGYTVEKVYIETLPGYYLAGNLFRPLSYSSKVPGILLAHGHWQYGRLENQPLFSGPTLGATLAQQGYVAFAYDMVGYNDTIQTPHEFGSPAEQLWSFSPLGLQLWNSTRALDFLESLPEIDPARIGMTGASGGGTQTFLLSAVDQRIKFAAPANMVSAEMQGGDFCENAPGLRVGTFNVEIAAMMAPRPMLLVSTSGDWTHNVPNFEYPAIRKIYSLYDKGAYVSNAHFVFPEHNFNRNSRGAVYQFFEKYLTPETASRAIVEENEEPPRLQDMLVFQGRPLPPGAKSYDELLECWKQVELASLGSLNRNELAEELALALGTAWPERVQSTTNGELTILSRPGSGDAVPSRWYPGKGSPILLVNPEGSSAAVGSEAFRSAHASGHPVLCIDAFQTGQAKTPRPKQAKFYLTFNRSDDQNRVQDILTAVAFLHEKAPGAIKVVGQERAGIWCLFAGAVAPIPVQVANTPLSFHGTDNEFLADFFVPGIQRAGGLATASILSQAPIEDDK
jgi:dienelactone hydrolase family protein